MGAVQRLATVVIIGLVALATALTVYIADEPDRRGGEVSAEDTIAIQRGTDLYVKYCLQCHGPAGKGASAADGRIGGTLNQEDLSDEALAQTVTYQSDDPTLQGSAEDFIRFRLQNGFPPDPRLEKRMPAFGAELNVEEIDDLVYLIMNGDWDYVYNESVIQTGENNRLAECAATPGLEGCDGDVDETEITPAYPTAPPTAGPTQAPNGADVQTAGESGTPAVSDQNVTENQPDSGSGSSPVATVEASDQNKWSVSEITAKPGDTIQVNNTGFLSHDFTVDELSIDDPLAGQAQTTVTIPADAQPGTYAFYCSVPGHREQGMEGTLTIVAG